MFYLYTVLLIITVWCLTIGLCYYILHHIFLTKFIITSTFFSLILKINSSLWTNTTSYYFISILTLTCIYWSFMFKFQDFCIILQVFYVNFVQIVLNFIAGFSFLFAN